MTAAAALPAVAGPARWEPVLTRAPRLGATMLAYLEQLAVSQRPATIQSTDTALRLFAGFVLDHDGRVRRARHVHRRRIEAYKTTLVAPRPPDGRPLKPMTVRMRLGMLRLFFERIIEWGWDDSPARCPVFESDLPRVDDPLPKFLDDPSAARFMRAAAQLDPLGAADRGDAGPHRDARQRTVRAGR